MFEIDYIPVGDGEKGGDAIAIRLGNLAGSREEQKVIVIDGGTKESGKKLVAHILNYYGTDYVDSVICTHLHADHASGLTEVLENLRVGELVMNLPWNHSAEIKGMFKDKSISTDRLANKLEKSLTTISDLEDLAIKKKIPVIEPVSGMVIQEYFLVLSPSAEYYEELLINFSNIPEPNKEFSITEELVRIKKAVSNWISETIDIFTETLDDSGETSSENNSSTIILLDYDNRKLLFTGDAGIPALNRAIQFAKSQGVDLSDINFLDMPHHGSKRNIGATLLNYFKPQTAFISAPLAGDPKHPSRKVVNALKRRGSKVFKTKGAQLLHHNGGNRNWSPAEEEEFFDAVEE